MNGASPPVGADQYVARPGDRVLWYWATFGPSGGPRTLDLVRTSRACVRAYSSDDAGNRRRERDVRFRVNGRWVSSASGAYCSGGWRLVRATKAGLVRSQVLHR